MSSWPLVSDFARMLKTPKAAFRDPQLRECTIETNHLGQPKPRSGNFATVYKAVRPDGRAIAVRTFNRRSEHRRERYQQVSEFLKSRSAGSAAINSLVDFAYDEKGIRSASDAKMYPMVTMEWVPGLTLYEWARDRSREGYREALTIAADVWLQVVRELAAGGIVHGDLQHGNVMVSQEGYIKLVDYDCLGVPSLMGQPNLELGMEPYQHPGRNADTALFPGLDNFSALVIYVALRALAAAPHLWITHVDQTGYDKLLFRKEDFQNPQASQLYHELLHSPDEQVRDLTHYLMQLVQYDLHDVPPVDEVLLWCNSLDDLLSQRDWDMAVQLVKRMGPSEQIPAHLTALVDEAHRRVACRQALEKALAAGDEAAIIRSYVPQLLDDYPAAAELVAQARAATQVRQVLETLRSARDLKNWEVFRQTWMANQQLLYGRKSAEPYKKEMQRIIAVDTLRKLCKDTNADDTAIVEAWKYLQSLGEHPTIEPLRPHLKWREERHGLYTKLRKMLADKPEQPTLEHDRAFVEAWKANYFEGHERYKEILTFRKAAVQRLKKLKALLDQQEQCTIESEKAFYGATAQFPQNYHPQLRQRCRLATKRLKALQKVHQATEEGGSDLALLEARDVLGETDAETLITDEQKKRIELAKKRKPLLEKLSGFSQTWPPAELDNKLLEVWDEKLLDDCTDVEQWQPIYQRAKQRKIVLEGLEEAIENVDTATIESLMADPCLRGFPLPSHITQGVEHAQERHQQQQVARRQGLINSIMEGDRGTFAELFDAKVLRELCEQYHHHQAVVGRLIESDVLPLARSGLGKPEGEALTRDEETEGEFLARWRWPPAKFARTCRLIVSEKPPAAHTNPDEAQAVYSVSISFAQWQADGQSHRIKAVPEWAGYHVTVWFNIDLGFQSFFSQPLDLGTLTFGKKPKRWGLFG